MGCSTRQNMDSLAEWSCDESVSQSHRCKRACLTLPDADKLWTVLRQSILRPQPRWAGAGRVLHF
jgi:hypothetical protein